MVAERAAANSWPERLVDVARRARSTLDETLQEVDSRTGRASKRDAGQSGVSTGIDIVSEMRDGDKSKLLGNGILKVVTNIIDIIAHKSLGMDVREQADNDNVMVETLEGTKNEWRWFKANLGANATLAIPMTVCRACAAVTLADERTHKFVMPVLSFNGINDESRAINRSACQEFIVVPTGAL